MRENGRRLAFAVALVALGAMGALVFAACGDDDTPEDSDSQFGGTPLPDLPGAPTAVPGTGPLGAGRPEVGQKAPDFALVDVFDDTVVHRLSDFEGTPVVLNWYASWCGPCKEELPLYQSAADQLEGQVAFFAVNLIEGPEAARGILEELGITFPAVLDPNGAVSDRWRVSFMPTTYFIDAEGIVRAQRVGPVSEGELQSQLAEMGVTFTP